MNLDEWCHMYETQFETAWTRLTSEWNAEGEDAFWLIAHASYLLRTGAVRWGVDLSLREDAIQTCVRAHDLSALAFVLTTHFHGDHFSQCLCARLAENDTLWVLPDFMPETLREGVLRAGVKTRFVRAGDEFVLKGCRIRVLPGHHYDDGGAHGVPSCAYTVETNGKVLFFPGDVRDYRVCPQTDCVGADALFAHVWLGRGRAQLPIERTFIESYCDYLAGARAKTVYFTHLNDYTRQPEERWTERHALAVCRGLRARQNGVRMQIPRIGEKQML